jgi:hypothetical protein
MRDIIYKRIQIKRLLEDDNLGLAAYCFILELKTEHTCKPRFLVRMY